MTSAQHTNSTEAPSPSNGSRRECISPVSRLFLSSTIGRGSAGAPAILGLLIGLAVSPATIAETRADGAPARPALTGTVRYAGEPIRARAIRMDADPKCAQLHEGRVFADDLIVGEERELANVFVYVEGPPKGSYDSAVPSRAATLSQHGCLYRPRVQGLRVQQKLEVENDDPTLHNVRSLAKENRAFNLGQPENSRRTKFFTKPEKPVEFKCDVHPWMSAFIFVMEHPFFDTTDTTGTFSIEDLPPGKYTLVVWHELLGETRREVELGRVGLDLEIDLDRPTPPR